MADATPTGVLRMALPPLLLLLAASPEAPGCRTLLQRALTACAERPVHIHLTLEGLTWAKDPELMNEAGTEGLRLSVCSQAARSAGWTLDNAPLGIAWSSVARALAEDAERWVALP